MFRSIFHGREEQPWPANYNTSTGNTWRGGDFTFDAAVNFDDLAILAQRYNSALPAAGVPGASAALNADWAAAIAQVPEPHAVGLVALAAAAALLVRPRPPLSGVN